MHLRPRNADQVMYGLLVTCGTDARMFLVRSGETCGYLARFAASRFGTPDRMSLATWGGKALAASEPVPPEGTPLILRPA